MTEDTTDTGFRAGELVEVRSEEEILQTLDAHGMLDALPFMPEMLEFCGQRFRVRSRAHKACDTVDWGTMRRMENAVHLEGLRCDGQAHGGCQAGCLIYWRDAWLKRVSDSSIASPIAGPDAAPRSDTQHEQPACTREMVLAATRKDAGHGDEVFSCQATELLRATTSDLPWWEPGQYVEDVRSRNASVAAVVRGLFVGLVNKLQKASARVLPRSMLVHGGRTYPLVLGQLVGATPADRLDLQPGELVEVKSREEIFETLNEMDRTRGLRFDGEMLRYCGRRGKVLRRIERIIDEKSGKMLPIESDCILIEEFVCAGDYHRSCPRAAYTWWRECWLRRVAQPGVNHLAKDAIPAASPRTSGVPD